MKRWLTMTTLLAMTSSTACAAALPEQFDVWGKQAKPNSFLVDADHNGPGAIEVQAEDGEKQQGFVIFGKPCSVVVNGDYEPASTDRLSRLTAKDCPGEYGPMNLIVWALEKGAFTVSVSDLSNGTHTLGRENLDVRCARMIVDKKGRVFPAQLEAFDKVSLAPNRFGQFWITYYIPKGTPAGLYTGTVTIQGEKGAASIPVELEVYPFTLAPSSRSLYIYGQQPTQEQDMDTVLRRYIDQRCHGMNNALLTLPVSADGDMTAEQVRPWIAMYKKAGFDQPQVHVLLWNRIISAWTSQDKSKDMACDWFLYYPFSRELDDRYVKTVRMIAGLMKAQDLELIISVADEAGSHPWTTEATQHYLKLLKQQVPGVKRELTVGGGWAMGRSEHELWKGLIHNWATNRWFDDKIKQVLKDDPKAEIEIYNMGGGGSGFGGLDASRAVYGYFLWKSKAAGVSQWVYWHPATQGSSYVWPAENGLPVPTLRWELVREGTKDLRYLEKLEAVLKAKNGPDAEVAKALLAEIDSTIELRHQDYDVIDGGRVPTPSAGTFDAWRQRAAQAIINLQK
ncbi:MAG: hypothetical protein WD042_15025 [Phycisphaeraceae bacterium]